MAATGTNIFNPLQVLFVGHLGGRNGHQYTVAECVSQFYDTTAIELLDLLDGRKGHQYTVEVDRGWLLVWRLLHVV